MISKTILRLILFTLFTNTVSAQFIGSYSLQDGGVDVQNSQLCILPNNEFAIASIGRIILGKWTQDGNNKIILKEVKNEKPFMVYGFYDKNKSSEKCNIEFQNFEKADASISFIDNSLENNVYLPVFNDDPNCFESEYIINRNLTAIKQIDLICHQDIDFQNQKLEYPYNGLVYSFPISNRFNCYKIIFDPYALHKNTHYELIKKKDVYFLNSVEIGEREELSKKIIHEISEYKFKFQYYLDNGSYKYIELPTEKIITSDNPKIIKIIKSKMKPLFTVSCNDH